MCKNILSVPLSQIPEDTAQSDQGLCWCISRYVRKRTFWYVTPERPISEDTQEMPQSRNTVLKRHQKKERWGTNKDRTNSTFETTEKKKNCNGGAALENQPAHPDSLIRVFVVHMQKHCILAYPKSAQWRFWSACATLIWIFAVRMSFVRRYIFASYSFQCICNQTAKPWPVHMHRRQTEWGDTFQTVSNWVEPREYVPSPAVLYVLK